MGKKAATMTLEELEKKLAGDLGEDRFYLGREGKIRTPIPTGHLSLDKALKGGFPRGKLSELFGNPSSGKTLIALNAIAKAQQAGGNALYIDLEKTFDPVWAAKNGVDLGKLRVLEPADGEEAYEILEAYLRTNEMDIIVLDSVAQVVPRAELEGSVSDAHIGRAARLNAQAMRRLISLIGDCALIMINQMRSKVSTGPFAGNPDTTTGGRAIPFYASLRIKLTRTGWEKSGETKTGATYKAKVEKAKVMGIHPQASIDFSSDFEEGLDIVKDVLLHAQLAGWVQKKGSWYVFDEETKKQGEAAAKEYMQESGLLDQWYHTLLTGEVNEEDS